MDQSVQNRIGQPSRAMGNNNLCEVVQDIPPGAAARHWVLRADYRCAGGSHHHAKGVKLSECPLYLELHWKRTRTGSIRRLGIFRLDLNGLLRGGYIRPESESPQCPEVRLRIFRADDGRFFVQTRHSEPELFFAADVA
jgi:hypothetical protein